MKITTKGQVTIPQAIRDRFGFLPHTEVEFRVVDGAVQIVKAAPTTGEVRGEMAVRKLRGRASRAMSTDQIMALTRADP